LVEEYKTRGDSIRKMKNELEEEINNYKILDSTYCGGIPQSIVDIRAKYYSDRKKILGSNVKPTSDEDMNRLKDLSKEYKKNVDTENNNLGIKITGYDKTELNRKICQSVRKIKNLEKQIYDSSRKNMHLHIALSLFRGTPLNKILSPKTRKKIRSESVYGFLESITEY